MIILLVVVAPLPVLLLPLPILLERIRSPASSTASAWTLQRIRAAWHDPGPHTSPLFGFSHYWHYIFGMKEWLGSLERGLVCWLHLANKPFRVLPEQTKGNRWLPDANDKSFIALQAQMRVSSLDNGKTRNSGRVLGRTTNPQSKQ